MNYSVSAAGSQARGYARFHADDSGLRTTLRNVPILPAPANVEDLLARLDPDNISSGPLAGIISDARLAEIDPARQNESSYDPFSVPFSFVANTNVPRPAPGRRSALNSALSAMLLNAALIVGATLITWNALGTPDVAPPLPTKPALVRSEASTSDVTTANEMDSRSGVTITWPEPHKPDALFQPSEIPASPEAALVDPLDKPASPEPTELGPREPQFEFLPVAPEPVSKMEITETVETVASLPEAAVDPVERIASAQPVEAPEPAVGAPEPGLTAEVGESGGTLASAEPPRSAVEGHKSRGAKLEVTVRAPTLPVRPEPRARLAKPRARVPFAGVWAESVEACKPAGREDGSLLAHISAHRARAGDTTCTFRKTTQTGNSWRIAALCSDKETSWQSAIRLSARGRRLTWTSQKGSTTYVQCGRV